MKNEKTKFPQTEVGQKLRYKLGYIAGAVSALDVGLAPLVESCFELIIEMEESCLAKIIKEQDCYNCLHRDIQSEKEPCVSCIIHRTNWEKKDAKTELKPGR